MLELRNVSKSYREGDRERCVFARLDTCFRGGEFTAVTGRSGSGKSTLLNLVSGIDLPDSGEVLHDGVNLAALPDRERTLHRRRHIGFVFQFFNLIPTLTVEENLQLPLELNGVRGAESRKRIAESLSAVGLHGRVASFPDRLSGGEQQRVAIARALVHRPGIILADEPTGNLDADTGTQILDLLCGLARECGATLVVATHSPNAAARADQVLAIAEG